MASANRVQVILQENTAESLQVLAEMERRSVSGMGSVIIEEYLEQRQAEIANSQRYLSIKARITSQKIRQACSGLPESKLEAIAEILEG